MNTQLVDLLLKDIPYNFETAEKWYMNELTQGNNVKPQVIKRITEPVHQAVYVINDKKQNPEQDPEQNPEQDPEQEINTAKLTPESMTKGSNVKRDYKKNNDLSFIDFIAGKVDDMFAIYPYETKRDIRQYTKGQLIDWVAKNARAFFGPSTSRAISACIRNQHTDMADVERFAEFVSFLMNVPVQAGTKIVVWHGYKEKTRIPGCHLFMKPHNVYIKAQ